MIWIFEIESVPSRYTYYWQRHIPKMLIENGHSVKRVSGEINQMEATEGAFLNFVGTNIFKSQQLARFASYIENGDVKNGDVVLFCDAWNPAIINVRYMIELMDLDVEIHSIWHAGSYDPADFLGRKVNKKWSYPVERAFFEASDINYFATDFHIRLFKETFPDVNDRKIVRTGFPMEYIADKCMKEKIRKPKVVFPHRMSVEKNPDFLKEVAKLLPEYEFVFCQEQGMNKLQYYRCLSDAALVWSGNEQETLGIGTFEGLQSGCAILVPDRLSYQEMYSHEWKYPVELLKDPGEMAYLIKRVVDKVIDPNHEIHQLIEKESKKVFDKFFCGDIMYKTL